MASYTCANVQLVDIELPDDLRPWVEARAAQIFRGDMQKAVIYLLREKHAREMRLLSKPSLRRPESDDMWSQLASEAKPPTG